MENTMQSEEAARGNENRGALGILLALAFLIPAVLIPVVGVPLQFTKVVVAALGVIALVAVYVGSALRNRTMTLAWSPLVAGLILLPLAYALSGLFSTNPALSFFGYEVDQDTFGFTLIGCALALATIWSLKSARGVFSVLTALLAGAWVVFLFQAIQVFFGAPFPASVLDSPVINTIGKWNDFALFTGLIVALALIALESLSVSMLSAIALYVTIAFGLFFLALVNFALAWILAGAFAFVTFIFALTRRSAEAAGKPRPPLPNVLPPAAVLLVTLYFLFVGTGVPASLQQSFGTQALEVRPSAEGTLSIISSVFAENPVFGSGPNTFSMDWLLHRPADVLRTLFWNSEFNAGFGYLPTAFTTGGLVVGLAWLVLIGLFVFVAFRYFFGPAGRDRSAFAAVTAGAGALYLLIIHIFYVPSQSLSLLFFLFLGLFVAAMHGTSAVSSKTVSFAENPRVGFVATLLLVVVIMAAFASVVGIGRLYAGGIEYGKAAAALSVGNYNQALNRAASSLSVVEQDRAYQIASLASLAKMNVLVNSKPAGDPAAQQEFRGLLSDAINASGKAVELNGKSFDNWMIRASIYSAVVPLQIEGAYENALRAYEEARKLNPGTPEIDFALAQIHQVRGELAEARAKAELALAKKPDYTPAILLAGQVALDQGNIKDAIDSVRAVLVFEPQNSTYLYQLGVLFLADKNYTDSALALEAALNVTKDFANAKFFLGQAYTFMDRKEDALGIYRDLLKENADNQLLKDIVAALEEGKNPFSQGVEAPPEPKKVP